MPDFGRLAFPDPMPHLSQRTLDGKVGRLVSKNRVAQRRACITTKQQCVLNHNARFNSSNSFITAQVSSEKSSPFSIAMGYIVPRALSPLLLPLRTKGSDEWMVRENSFEKAGERLNFHRERTV